MSAFFIARKRIHQTCPQNLKCPALMQNGLRSGIFGVVQAIKKPNYVGFLKIRGNVIHRYQHAPSGWQLTGMLNDWLLPKQYHLMM